MGEGGRGLDQRPELDCFVVLTVTVAFDAADPFGATTDPGENEQLTPWGGVTQLSETA
jgi:hypothetical protein